jgi:predicted lipoprotein
MQAHPYRGTAASRARRGIAALRASLARVPASLASGRIGARRAIAGALLALAALPADAQSDWARVAVPSYTPAHFMQGLHRRWTTPRAEEFAAQARVLVPALRGLCEAEPSRAAQPLRVAREHWRSTATAWERLSAVAVGPLIERRSLRQIDFAPTRPRLIEKAIAAEPRDGAAMERIGTPAKGLPALEWLLWTRPAAPRSAACRYAVAVAGEVEREATALAASFRELAGRSIEAWDDTAAVDGMNEFLNQWVGGIERLRWPQMEKPLRSGSSDELPRAASRTTAASWAAHWQAVRALAVFQDQTVPTPGAGLVPIETYLRGRGHNALADRLVQTVKRVDARVKAATPSAPPKVLAAARELAGLKRLAEEELAPALEVRIGFSDADGD